MRPHKACRGLVATLLLLLMVGCAGTGQVTATSPDDPWEGFNRKVFAFNDVLDRYALKPAARGYRAITPDPVETGVGNFFANLGEPRTVINSLLQGKPDNAGIATMRFVINSTAGIAGLWDVATPMKITGREEDFGQTLGVWGVAEGPYVVLPFFGPSTVRHTAGMPLDMISYPTDQVDPDRVRYGLTALRVIDTRAGLLDQEALIQGDRYSFIRDTWLQQRRFEVTDGEQGDDPFADQEFNFDDADFDDAFDQ